MELTSEQIAKNWITWLDALTSKKYKKGTIKLHRKENNTYCCLGVARECLAIKPGIKDESDIVYNAIYAALGLVERGVRPYDRNVLYNPDIFHLNDTIYGKNRVFTNMHRELLADVEGFTSGHPEVAPLVRKMLAEKA